jgi:hypothetical protein
MADRPDIKPGDWIRVGSIAAVVSSELKKSNDPFGDCEVVYNSSKPTNRRVKWNGSAWQFVENGDYGGYADKSDRLRPYVSILKRRRS